jgi:hypothetical protein
MKRSRIYFAKENGSRGSVGKIITVTLDVVISLPKANQVGPALVAGHLSEVETTDFTRVWNLL